MSPRHVLGSAQEIRLAWKAYLAAAEARAGAAIAGEPFDRFKLLEMVDGWRRFGPKGSPLPPYEDAAAQGMAAAFLKLAQTFTGTTGDQRRAQMGPVLERLAIALAEILEEPVRRAFDHSLHVLGERE